MRKIRLERKCPRVSTTAHLRWCAASPTRPSTAIPSFAGLNERCAKIVISQHPRRASPLPIDAEIYKWRHLTENFFCKLKQFKRIAMRADKTDQSFAANIHLAAALINFR